MILMVGVEIACSGLRRGDERKRPPTATTPTSRYERPRSHDEDAPGRERAEREEVAEREERRREELARTLEEACRRAESECESECRTASIHDDEGRSLWHTTFEDECEDACETGRHGCEREEDDGNDACDSFGDDCEGDCPTSILDWETSNYLYSYETNADDECEDACDDGRDACRRAL
jgi:hypothetical protein